MSKLPTAEQTEDYTPHGTRFNPKRLTVEVGPADEFGRRAVEARMYDSQHRGRFNADDDFRRGRFITEFCRKVGMDSSELSDAIDDAIIQQADAADESEERGQQILKMSFAEMRLQFPTLHPPVIDGIGREAEVVNIVSTSKAGKSWLMAYIMLCVITGRYIFGRFKTSQGPCLLIDNELHRPTIVYRVSKVAEAMGLKPSDYEQHLTVWSLRGNFRPFEDVAYDLEQFERGELKVIGWDSKYRFAKAGQDENSNSDQTQFHNRADRIAERTGALQLFVHHATKGSQSDRRVTDVGAGGGAQSRAVDSHLVLREHEEPGIAVLEAAVRSFAPVEPIALQWDFPLWKSVDGVDPGKLKGKQSRSEERQGDRDREGIAKISTALRKAPATARQLRRLTGLSKDRCERLLDQLQSDGQVTATEITIKGNKTYEYSFVKDTE